ncbi:uncharacterized protein ISCGN_024557 [Ixodes scapularis]
MKCKAETMEDVEKDCVLFLDEMEIATNLELDHAKNMLLGGITLPLKPKEPANHVLLYNEEERRLLCLLCGVPEIHRGTHQAGALHRARESAAAARAAVSRLAAIDEHNLQRALAVVWRLRPALLRPLSPADIAINIDDNDEPF